ncbi:MAG: MBL fold metallo-hydrolase [bacterium]
MHVKNSTTYTAVIFFLTLIILIIVSLPSKVAKLIVCDVGQGDALLLIKGDIQVLIDGGPRGDMVLACLSRHIPFWDRTIELVIFSNTDYDHLNGINSILTRYQIGKIITGDGMGESDATAQFIDILRSQNLRVDQVGQGDIVKVGQNDSLLFRVLWPKNPNKETLLALDPTITKEERSRVLGINIVKNTNERSVVIELDESGYKALLVGDIGEPTEQSLINDNLLTDVDLLKVGHHGSKYSSSASFLKILKPELAVISVGAKNTYGHPTIEALTRLKEVGATIRRTDQEGDIVVDLIK